MQASRTGQKLNVPGTGSELTESKGEGERRGDENTCEDGRERMERHVRTS